MDKREPLKAFLQNKWALRVLSVVVVFVVWEYFGRGMSRLLMSYPSDIFYSMVRIIQDGELPAALTDTLRLMTLGFVLSVAIAIPLGLLMGRFRVIEHIADPWISIIYVLPAVAIVPLLMLWFGIGFMSRLMVVFLLVFFLIVINTSAGVKNVSPDLIETARSLGANERQLFFRVILPASVPFVFAGLRLGIGRAVLGAVLAEMFITLTGLGGLLVHYSQWYKTGAVFSVILIMGLIGLGLQEAIKNIERRAVKWKPETFTT